MWKHGGLMALRLGDLKELKDSFLFYLSAVHERVPANCFENLTKEC